MSIRERERILVLETANAYLRSALVERTKHVIALRTSLEALKCALGFWGVGVEAILAHTTHPDYQSVEGP